MEEGQAQPLSVRLLFRQVQPPFPPDPLNALMVYSPFIESVKELSSKGAIAPVCTGQPCDRLYETRRHRPEHTASVAVCSVTAPKPCRWAIAQAVMRSRPRAVLVCSTSRCRFAWLEKRGCDSPRLSQVGLPKRQSRVRRRSITASSWLFSFSRSFSHLAAVYPETMALLLTSLVRLLHHTDLLDRPGNGLVSPHHQASTTRSLGMIYSACPIFSRGIKCPPLALTPSDSLAPSNVFNGG